MPKHIKVTLDFIPVEESMPKDGSLNKVLVSHPFWKQPHIMELQYLENSDCHWWYDDESHLDFEYTVTHWSPIRNSLTNAEE